VIYRAYMLLAVLWVLFCLATGVIPQAPDAWGPWVIALGPLALPKLAKFALGFIIFGRRYRPGA
jgi:hypothetical protein